MSEIIGDEACPNCRSKGHDRTGNHLIIFSDGGKHCNKCGYTDKQKDKQENNSLMQIKKDNGKPIDFIKDLPIKALQDRGISQEVCELYGVRTAFDETTGKPESYYYPITVGGSVVAYKQRKLPKTFSIIGQSLKGQVVEFIGQSVAVEGKRLLITEGQDDALAAYQMLGKYKQAVVSVPHGANINCFTDNKTFLSKYEEVILCPDQDEQGQKLVKDIVKLFPDIKIMDITEKDPNAMLLNGKEKSFVNSYFKAKPYVPDVFVTVEDVYEEACEMPTWGRLWPWPSLNNLTYGRRSGEGIYVGAAVKAGKTEWLSQMVHHIVETEKQKVFLIKFEQDPAQTVKAVAGKIAHKQFHKPDGDFTQEELVSAVDKVKGKVLMYNASYADVSYGNMWDRLKPVIRHAVVVEGIRDIFIDPITQLTDGMTPSETETELRRFSNELAGMSKDLGFFYYCFCHLKAPDNGKTHEEGGKVKVAQFRGSRAMAEKTKLMLGILRNQDAEDETERNTSKFHLLLNSGFGKSGRFDVFYDDEKGSYLEPTREFT